MSYEACLCMCVCVCVHGAPCAATCVDSGKCGAPLSRKRAIVCARRYLPYAPSLGQTFSIYALSISCLSELSGPGHHSPLQRRDGVTTAAEGSVRHDAGTWISLNGHFVSSAPSGSNQPLSPRNPAEYPFVCRPSDQVIQEAATGVFEGSKISVRCGLLVWATPDHQVGDGPAIGGCDSHSQRLKPMSWRTSARLALRILRTLPGHPRHQQFSGSPMELNPRPFPRSWPRRGAVHFAPALAAQLGVGRADKVDVGTSGASEVVMGRCRLNRKPLQLVTGFLLHVAGG